jgi:hypothetical protein
METPRLITDSRFTRPERLYHRARSGRYQRVIGGYQLKTSVIRFPGHFEVNRWDESSCETCYREKSVNYYSRPKYRRADAVGASKASRGNWASRKQRHAEVSQANLPFSQSLPVRATITTATIPQSWASALRPFKPGVAQGGLSTSTCQHVRAIARALLTWPN